MSTELPQELKVSSAADLETYLPAVRQGLQAKEGEGTWRLIDDAINTLAALVRGGAIAYPSFHSELATLATPFLTDALLTERTRLSGSAVELVVAFGQAVAKPLPVLIDVFVPALMKLCSRTNKVFVTRAKRCMIGLIGACQMTEALSQYHEALKSTNKTLRECAVEFVLTTVQSASPDALNAMHLDTVELAIKDAILDSAPKVRDMAKQCYKAYGKAYPTRLSAFHDTLSATARKYLSIGAAGADNSNKPAVCRFTVALRRQKLAAIKAQQEAAAQANDGVTTDISTLFSVPSAPLITNHAPQRIAVVNGQPKPTSVPTAAEKIPSSNSAPASPMTTTKQSTATEVVTTPPSQPSTVDSNPDGPLTQSAVLAATDDAPSRPLKRRASSPLPKPLLDATVRLDKAPTGIFNVLKKAKAAASSSDTLSLSQYPPRAKAKVITGRTTTTAAFPSYRRPTIASALRAQRANQHQPSLFRTLSETLVLPARKKRRTYSQSSQSSVTTSLPASHSQSPTKLLAQPLTKSVETSDSSYAHGHGESLSSADSSSASLDTADTRPLVDKSASLATKATNESTKSGGSKVSNIVASFETAATAEVPRTTKDRNPKTTANKRNHRVLTTKSASTTNSHRSGTGHFRSLTATKSTDAWAFMAKSSTNPKAADSQTKAKHFVVVSADKSKNKACPMNETKCRGGNINSKHATAAVGGDGKENNAVADTTLANVGGLRSSGATGFQRDRLVRKRQVALMRRRYRRRESQPYTRVPVDETVNRRV
ncbi:hypothetical protein H4R35_000255 [Dimargaris xerosporica]|nr:hypothetical protein H4R35_000255 [Dimargaris xerosporica]